MKLVLVQGYHFNVDLAAETYWQSDGSQQRYQISSMVFGVRKMDIHEKASSGTGVVPYGVVPCWIMFNLKIQY